MQHSFDITIAEKFGVNSAIFLNNLAFWIQKNLANKKHIHDNRAWTYNSQEAFTKLFPYWSRQNMRTIIKNCMEEGLILKGNFNEKQYDRTEWYAFTDLGLEYFESIKKDHIAIGWNQPMDGLELTNGLVGTNQPIPDINTDKIKSFCSSNDELPFFEQFYFEYPRHQKKKEARELWKKLELEKIGEQIVAHVKRRKETEWRDKEINFIPLPNTFIRGKLWDDEIMVFHKIDTVARSAVNRMDFWESDRKPTEKTLHEEILERSRNFSKDKCMFTGDRS